MDAQVPEGGQAWVVARRKARYEACWNLHVRNSKSEEGIEATISQGVRAFDLRRSRYIGLEKTRLQHISIAAAINLVRISAWLRGEGTAPTRVSAFERLFSGA